MGALRHHHYLKYEGFGWDWLPRPGVPYDAALVKEIQDSITASVIQGIEAANKDAAQGKPEDAIRATITSALQNRFIPAQQRNAVSDIVARLYHEMALQKWRAQIQQVLRTHQWAL